MVNVRKILLLEDDPNDVELTLAALYGNRLAKEVVVARDGEVALDYLYHRGTYTSREVEALDGAFRSEAVRG